MRTDEGGSVRGRRVRKRWSRRSDGEKKGVKGSTANSTNRRDTCSEKAKEWKAGRCR